MRFAASYLLKLLIVSTVCWKGVIAPTTFQLSFAGLNPPFYHIPPSSHKHSPWYSSRAPASLPFSFMLHARAQSSVPDFVDLYFIVYIYITSLYTLLYTVLSVFISLGWIKRLPNFYWSYTSQLMWRLRMPSINVNSHRNKDAKPPKLQSYSDKKPGLEWLEPSKPVVVFRPKCHMGMDQN